MNTRSAFTLIELLIVIGIAGLVFTFSLPALLSFGRMSDLQNAAETTVNTLRLAQGKAVGSEGASRWGVYFSTSTAPHQYTLFKGSSYASRDTAQDRVYRLPSSVEILQMTLAQGSRETAFDRITGTTATSGTIVLGQSENPAQQVMVSIGPDGRIYLGTESSASSPEEPTLRDSRHVHAAYTRFIATASETIVLNFDGGSVTQTIAIADTLRNGQIEWEGTIPAGGENQTIRIRTHRLNSPDTIVSFHRDRRSNTKNLTVSLSGDASGNVIAYSADGLTTTKTSIYASAPEWR